MTDAPLAAKGQVIAHSTVVAVHQPNYLPWLGYFYKIANAGVFVFLDDAQYSKNGYTNRVRVLGPSGDAKWLTVPVSYQFGDPINKVRPAQRDWKSRHLDTLSNYYRSAPCFAPVWAGIKELYRGSDDSDLSSANRYLVEGIAGELGLSCQFTTSSQLAVDGMTSDDRLVALVATIDPQGTYLSGSGGSKYQDPTKFAASGLGFCYTDFQHPQYDQGQVSFTPGLSILDAVFILGWAGAAKLLTANNP